MTLSIHQTNVTVHLALYFHDYCSQVLRSLALPHDLDLDFLEQALANHFLLPVDLARRFGLQQLKLK